jgi:uncharacterized protein YdeI (YjbR/CyaY-like superfamily)
MNPTFFPTPAAFREWLDQHHAMAQELWVGFYKKGAGKPGMTYAEAVDEALCYGWIDGIIKRVNDESYMHRFSPRKPRSIWSNLNVAHVDRLTAAGRMHPAGLAAYAARDAARTGIYSFEARQPKRLPPGFLREFRANRKAWAFFQAQSESYRRLATHRITSAKKPETRERWLQRIIAASVAGRKAEL